MTTCRTPSRKCRLLGDIPIIGGLFRYKTRSHVKTNLMVFLRPTIIRDNEQSVSLTGDRYDYIRNAEVTGQPGKATLLPNTDLLPNMGTAAVAAAAGRPHGGRTAWQQVQIRVKQAKPSAPADTPNDLPQKPAAQRLRSRAAIAFRDE